MDTVCTCDLLIGGFFAPLDGITRFMLLSSSGVVIMKMISSTNARSSSGVTLISLSVERFWRCEKRLIAISELGVGDWKLDRKSTRLNSSHRTISYAVF